MVAPCVVQIPPFPLRPHGREVPMIYAAFLIIIVTIMFALIILGARSDEEWVEWQR